MQQVVVVGLVRHGTALKGDHGQLTLWSTYALEHKVMHQTIERVLEVVASGHESKISPLLAEQVRFLPPTYFKTWTGRAPVAALLAHVGQVFSDFTYRRVMGDGSDWALEFECKIGELDAVGVDLITLDESGLIAQFEVVMRPYKSIGALREAMNRRVMTDARFLRFKDALS